MPVFNVSRRRDQSTSPAFAVLLHSLFPTSHVTALDGGIGARRKADGETPLLRDVDLRLYGQLYSSFYLIRLRPAKGIAHSLSLVHASSQRARQY